MINRFFLSDALRYGAILGVIMGLSRVFEIYLFNCTEVDIVPRVIIILVESLTVVVVYLWLMYKFTRRHSMRYSPSQGFSFFRGLAFMLLLSMLTSIVVGAANYIYIEIIGYENYIWNSIARITEMFESLPGGVGENGETLDDVVAILRDKPKPSMFDSLFSSTYTYLVGGLICGLCLAAMAEKRPESESHQNNFEE